MKIKKAALILICLVLVLIPVFSGCTYNPPDGHTKKHHTYEEVLAYARTLDPNATVSEEYTDTTIDDWNRSFREWPAVINGVECHVSSVGDMIFNEGFAGGEFAKQYFYIDTDYDYLLLEQIVNEKQPEWCMKYDDLSSRYNWNHILSVQTSYIEKRQLSDAELETAWQEAYEIYEEYNKYPVHKQACFCVAAPAVYVSGGLSGERFIKITSNYIDDFSSEGKADFFNQYKEDWALMDSDLPIQD